MDGAIRRIRRQSAPLATEENIENPIICLKPSDAIIFDLNLADPRENTSFPKYARNSELNTNTDFDNGEFRILEYYITRTNLNIERFIFSFAGVNPNPGPNGDTYVFYDSQNIENLLIVAVQDDCGNYNQVQERDSRTVHSHYVPDHGPVQSGEMTNIPVNSWFRKLILQHSRFMTSQ